MKRKILYFVVAVSLGFLIGAYFFSGVHNPARPDNSGPPPVYAANFPKATPPSFVNTAKHVTPAVVKIISTMEISSSPAMGFGDDFGFGDNFWKRFFGVPRTEKVQGLGSGFFISSDGYIVTNNHVVKDAKKIDIFTYDGNSYRAKLIGKDEKTDLALLKVKGKNFLFLKFGDSQKLQVGQWVMAIGNPLGTEFSVTAGIISAKGRQLSVADYADYIQTDAAINRGNSGGPLVNLNGEVIGVNSVIITPNQGFVGIGFSIPSNLVKIIVRELKLHGKVIRGWLGVMVQRISPEDKDALGLKSVRGAIISQVVPGGPADKAGLKPYDVVVKINGKEIKNETELKVIVGATMPGNTLTLEIIRNGKRLIKKVKVGKLGKKSINDTDTKKASVNNDLGMKLVALTKRVAYNYGIPVHGGLLVLNVKRFSPADDAGFQRGDIIVEVNRVKVNTVEKFKSLISYAKKKGRRAVIFKVRQFDRQGNIYEIIRSVRLD